MVNRTLSSLLLVLLSVVACREAAAPPTPDATPRESPPALPAEDIEITDGQTVYVPVYSHVYFMSTERPYALAITLSVRNTDPELGITLTDVSYYGTDGEPIERYVTEPRELGPMASTEFFVGQSDMRGGSGANFIVTWEAEREVYEPVVEATMIGTAGTQGVSFLSQGRVYQERR